MLLPQLAMGPESPAEDPIRMLVSVTPGTLLFFANESPGVKANARVTTRREIRITFLLMIKVPFFTGRYRMTSLKNDGHRGTFVLIVEPDSGSYLPL